MTVTEMRDRQLADVYERDRQQIDRKGYLRRSGSHADGKPRYVLTWRGRKATVLYWIREAWEAWCEVADEPKYASMIVVSLAGGLVLAMMFATAHWFGVTP